MMRSVALDFSHRRLCEHSIPEPCIEFEDQVLFRIEQVGVCGTDRALAAFEWGYPPAGESFLVLGHEALGRVLETGGAVKAIKPGDWVVPAVRRSCSPPCRMCSRGRRDLCLSGGYQERGIFGLHGYFTQYAVDRAEDLILVPETVAEFAVLVEPLSVVEKAIEKALRIRDDELRRALVLGAGPIGLLAALALKARGPDVRVHSLEPGTHARARLVRDAGMEYLDRISGSYDLVIEATGAIESALEGLRHLGPMGVLALIGGGAGQGHLRLRDMVLNNQIIFGTVNASPQSFSMALADLGRFEPAILNRLIRRLDFREFELSITGPPQEAPKLVHVIH